MKPYWTILLDSFRMLKARAIFWVTMGISILVALIYLSIGFDETGTSFFFGASHMESDIFRAGEWQSETMYVAIFTKLIAEYWLSWVAVLLAMISCANIFPDAMDEGTAGMLLTKKLPRFHVFLAKFIGSFLFTALQVILFVTIVFLALRWRLGSWNPSVFLFVPLILLVFIYLYSFLVLVAVKTKSVMTALILTLLLWGISSAVGVFEGFLYTQGRMVDAISSVTTEQSEVKPSKFYHRVKAVYTFLPKTGGTLDVADDLLVINGKKGVPKGSFTTLMAKLTLASALGVDEEGYEENLESLNFFEEQLAIEEAKESRHSVAFSIGTSLLFALAMFLFAARSFCRKEI